MLSRGVWHLHSFIIEKLEILVQHWLEPSLSAHKQLKGVQPMALCFRVKFYPSDPLKLKEEITRYYLFLQLRRDLHHGRLLCTTDEASLLTAHIAQAELGDYDTIEGRDYISNLKMIPKQALKHEDKVAEFHKSLKGLAPVEAEEGFLKIVSKLDTYGVDPHPVKDDTGSPVYLGVTHLGIVTFKGNKRTHLLKWPQIIRLGSEGKHFLVFTNSPEQEESLPSDVQSKRKSYKHAFKCSSVSACKHLWKCAIQQQFFFTLQTSKEAPVVRSRSGLLRRGSSYRYSGRCESEAYKDSEQINREPPAFKRSTSTPQIVRTFSNLHGNTLPRDFRLSEENNETSQRPHSLNLDDTFVRLDTSIVNSSIPEEPVVEISETPYSPCQSPDEPQQLVTGDSYETSDVSVVDQCSAIEEPQCSVETAVRQRFVTISAEKDVVCEQSVDVQEASSVGVQQLPQSIDERPQQIEQIQQNQHRIQQKILILSVILLLVVVLSLILLFEVDCTMPVVTSVRQSSQIRWIRRHLYLPLRNTFTGALW